MFLTDGVSVAMGCLVTAILLCPVGGAGEVWGKVELLGGWRE